MQKFFRGLLFAAITAGVASSPAFAGELTITMAEGRVTVIAQDVPLRQILAEWARVGKHQDRPCGEAYWRAAHAPARGHARERGARYSAAVGCGLHDRAPSDARGGSLALRPRHHPRDEQAARGGVSAAPQPFARPALPQPLPPQPPPDDDNGDPGDQGPNAPPGAQGPPGAAPPGFQPFPGQNPGMPPGARHRIRVR